MKKQLLLLAFTFFFLARVQATSYFWIGGSGAWNNTAKWSLSDGGGTAGSLPGNTDDVFFTSLSGFTAASKTITIPVGTSTCRNMTFDVSLNGLGVAFVGGATTNRLDVNGSVTLATGMDFTAWYGNWYLYQSTTGASLNFSTGNNTFYNSLMRFETPSSGTGGNFVVNGNFNMANSTAVANIRRLEINLQNKTHSVTFNNNCLFPWDVYVNKGTLQTIQGFTQQVLINGSLATISTEISSLTYSSWLATNANGVFKNFGNITSSALLNQGEMYLNAANTAVGNTINVAIIDGYSTNTVGAPYILDFNNCQINLSREFVFGGSLSSTGINRTIIASGSTLHFLGSAISFMTSSHAFNNVIVDEGTSGTLGSPFNVLGGGTNAVHTSTINTLIVDRNSTFDIHQSGATVRASVFKINNLKRFTAGHEYNANVNKRTFIMTTGSTIDMLGTCQNPIFLSGFVHDFTSLSTLNVNYCIFKAVCNASPLSYSAGSGSYKITGAAITGWTFGGRTPRTLVWQGGCNSPTVVTLPTLPITNTNAVNTGLNFTLTETTNINSVDLYATYASTNTGSAQIQIMDLSNSSLIGTYALSVPAGANNTLVTLNLNVSLPPGNYRIFKNTAAASISFRYHTGASFPIALVDNFARCQVGSITGGAPTAANYNFFYNWKVTSFSSLAKAWYNSQNWHDVTALPGWTSDPQIAPYNSGYGGGTCPPTEIDSVIFPNNSYVTCDKPIMYCEGMNWQGNGQIDGNSLQEMEVWGSLYLSPQMKNSFKGTFWFRSNRPYLCWITTNNQQFNLGVVFNSENGNGSWLLKDSLNTRYQDADCLTLNGLSSFRLSSGHLHTGTQACTPGNGQPIKTFGMQINGGILSLYDSDVYVYGAATSTSNYNFLANGGTINSGTSRITFQPEWASNTNGICSGCYIPKVDLGTHTFYDIILKQKTAVTTNDYSHYLEVYSGTKIRRLSAPVNIRPIIRSGASNASPAYIQNFNCLGGDLFMYDNSTTFGNTVGAVNKAFAIRVDTLQCGGGLNLGVNLYVRKQLNLPGGFTHTIGTSSVTAATNYISVFLEGPFSGTSPYLPSCPGGGALITTGAVANFGGNCFNSIIINNGTFVNNSGDSLRVDYAIFNNNTVTGTTPGAGASSNSISNGITTGWFGSASQPRKLRWKDISSVTGNVGNFQDANYWEQISPVFLPAPQCPPIRVDTVLFDNTSFSANNQQVQLTGITDIASMYWENIPAAQLPQLVGATAQDLTIRASLHWHQNMVNNHVGDIYFRGAPSVNFPVFYIRSSNISFRSNIRFIGDNDNTTWHQLDSLYQNVIIDNNNAGVSDTRMYLNRGKYYTKGFNLNIGGLYSTTTTNRFIDISNATVTLRGRNTGGSGGGINWNISGTPLVNGVITSFNINAANSTIQIPSGIIAQRAVFQLGGRTYNKIITYATGQTSFGPVAFRRDSINTLLISGGGVIATNIIAVDSIYIKKATISIPFTIASKGGKYDTLQLNRNANITTSNKYRKLLHFEPGYTYNLTANTVQWLANKAKVELDGGSPAGIIQFYGVPTSQQAYIRKDSAYFCADYVNIRDVWAIGNGNNPSACASYTNPGPINTNCANINTWINSSCDTITDLASSCGPWVGSNLSTYNRGRADFNGGVNADLQGGNVFGWAKNGYPPNPILNLTSATHSVCPGTAITLNMSGTANPPFTLFYIANGVTNTQTITSSAQLTTYNSTTGAFTYSTVVTPTVSTTYNLGFLTIDRCFSPQSATGTGTVNVTIRPIPLGVSSNFVPSALACNGAVLTLTATSSAGTNYTLYPTSTGTTGAMPLTSYTVGASTNGSITINASGTYTAGSSPATYTVYTDVTTQFGCPAVSRVPVTFTVNPTPLITNASAQSICTGNTATISAINSFTDNVVNNWSSPTIAGITGHNTSGTGNDITETLTNTTINPINVAYTYTPTVGTCAGTAQQFTVTVNPAPTMSSPTATTICSGNSLNLALTSNISGSTFNWLATDNTNTSGESTSTQNTSSLTDAITNNVTSLQIVTYTVVPTGTVGSCNGAAQIVTVNINPTPQVTSANTTTVCSGTALNLGLTANVASIYTWVAANNSNVSGESTSNVVSNTINNTLITTAGGSDENVLYTITPMSSAGSCLGTAQQVTVTVNALPSVTATASSASVCAGSTATLTASGTDTYSWAAGPTSSTYTVNTANTFTVTGTNTVTGCKNTANVTLAVNPLPVVTANASNATICSGNTATLTAGGAVTYAWTSPASTNTVITVTPTAATIYTVTGTDANNCVNTKTVSVAVNATPTVAITASNNTICIGNSSALTLAGATTYTLLNSNNPIASGASVSPTTTTTYSIQGSTGTCTSSATQQIINVNALPVVTATTSAASICSGNTATLTAAGANTYTWTSGPTSATYTVNITNNYVVTGTDANNCVNTATVNLTVNPTPTVNIAASSGTICSGQTATLTAATANSYAWSTTSTASTTTVMPTGTTVYTVTGTNTAGGCTATAQFTVSVNPKPDMALTNTTSIVCLGDANGTATVNTTSGTSGYNYTWTGSASTSSLATGLSAGSHTVQVTDSRGCKDTLVVNIAAPSLSLSTSVATATTGCSLSNGTATVTPSGGWNPGYTYIWQSNASTTNTATGYAAGTYTAQVADANGCVKVQNFTISNPSTPTIAAIASNPTICSGISTTITPSGAVSYSISGGAVSSPTVGTSFTVNPTGNTTYSIVGTDASNCISTTATVAINVNATPTVAISATNNTICIGNSSTLNLTGANTYTLLNTGSPIASGTIISPTATTTYSIQGTTGACTSPAAQQVIIVNPLPVVTATANSVAICVNQTATLTAAGANTYTWTSGPTAATYTTATAGTYTVTGTNALTGCTNTANVSLLVKPLPTVTAISNTTAICVNQTATLTAGGAATYTWTNPASTNTIIAVSPTITSNYVVTGTDGNNCVNTQTVTLTVNQLPSITASTITNVSCFGLNNGSVNFTTASGTPTYVLTGTNISGTTAGNLAPTNYTYTVTDAAGCVNTTTLSITQPTAALTANAAVTTTNSSCTSPNGAFAITATGGTSAYNYSIDGGALTTNSLTTNLGSGTHSFVVTDAKGCTTSTGTVNISGTPGITSSVSNKLDVLCYGNNTASVSVTGASGSSYNYTLTPITATTSAQSNTTGTFTGLSAGTYSVLVKDQVSNCISTNMITINTPTGALALTGITVNSVVCNGGTAQVTATVTGGTPSYNYAWSSNTSTLSTATYTAGSYHVNINDANGCLLAAQNFTVAQAPVLSIASVATTTTGCGLSNASATLAANGGWSTYSYTITGTSGVVSNTNTATNLSAGSYSVTIKDALGCATQTLFTISNPTASTLSIMGIAPTICAGQTATLTPGGAISYTLNGTSFTTSTTVSPVATTLYSITGTDAANCTSAPLTVTVNVNALPAISVAATATAICAGKTVTLTASGTDSYVWASGPTTNTYVVNATGTYSVTGTNTLTGCTSVPSIVTLTVSPIPTLALASQTNILCFGNANGTVTFTTNAVSPVITPTTTGLSVGVYTFTITDNASSCSNTITTTITGPTLALTAVVNNTTTNTSCTIPNGAFTVTAAGGTPNYTYNTTNTTGIFTGQGTGTQNIIVTDANSCTYTLSATVPGVATPSISAATQTNVLCNGQNTGSAIINVANGTAPYTYSWVPVTITTNTATLLSAGVYTVIATDAGNCKVMHTFVIQQPTPINALMTSNVSPCVGQNNGSASIEAIGGTPNYTYSWTNNSSTTSSISDVYEGQYTATITDANGCKYQYPLQITAADGVGCTIKIPEIYSPNGDGKNDTWEIKGLENYPNNTLQVFNRWGDEVFKAAPYNNDWKGGNKGDKSLLGQGALPVGTYYFILDLGNGDKPVTGYVQLTK